MKISQTQTSTTTIDVSVSINDRGAHFWAVVATCERGVTGPGTAGVRALEDHRGAIDRLGLVAGCEVDELINNGIKTMVRLLPGKAGAEHQRFEAEEDVEPTGLLGVIEWEWNKKNSRGQAVLSLDDGTIKTAWADEPITASSNNCEYEGLFIGYEIVAHDGKFLHVEKVGDDS